MMMIMLLVDRSLPQPRSTMFIRHGKFALPSLVGCYTSFPTTAHPSVVVVVVERDFLVCRIRTNRGNHFPKSKYRSTPLSVSTTLCCCSFSFSNSLGPTFSFSTFTSFQRGGWAYYSFRVCFNAYHAFATSANNSLRLFLHCFVLPIHLCRFRLKFIFVDGIR